MNAVAERCVRIRGYGSGVVRFGGHTDAHETAPECGVTNCAPGGFDYNVLGKGEPTFPGRGGLPGRSDLFSLRLHDDGTGEPGFPDIADAGSDDVRAIGDRPRTRCRGVQRIR